MDADKVLLLVEIGGKVIKIGTVLYLDLKRALAGVESYEGDDETLAETDAIYEKMRAVSQREAEGG